MIHRVRVSLFQALVALGLVLALAATTVPTVAAQGMAAQSYNAVAALQDDDDGDDDDDDDGAASAGAQRRVTTAPSTGVGSLDAGAGGAADVWAALALAALMALATAGVVRRVEGRRA